MRRAIYLKINTYKKSLKPNNTYRDNKWGFEECYLITLLSCLLEVLGANVTFNVNMSQKDIIWF